MSLGQYVYARLRRLATSSALSGIAIPPLLRNLVVKLLAVFCGSILFVVFDWDLNHDGGVRLILGIVKLFAEGMR